MVDRGTSYILLLREGKALPRSRKPNITTQPACHWHLSTVKRQLVWKIRFRSGMRTSNCFSMFHPFFFFSFSFSLVLLCMNRYAQDGNV